MRKIMLMNEFTHPILVRLAQSARQEPLEDRQKMVELLDAIGPGFNPNTLTSDQESLLDRAMTYVGLFNTFVAIANNVAFQVNGQLQPLTEMDADIVASALVRQALMPSEETADLESILDPTTLTTHRDKAVVNKTTKTVTPFTAPGSRTMN